MATAAIQREGTARHGHEGARRLPASGPIGIAYRRALRFLREATQARLAAGNESGSGLDPGLGELLGTLLESGEPELAYVILERLLAAQRLDGSWTGSRPPAQLTADAMRGLLIARSSRPATEAPLRRAADWCLRHARPRVGPLGWWEKAEPLAVAAALDAAGTVLGENAYREAARTMAAAARHPLRRAARDLRARTAHLHEDALRPALDLGLPAAVERRLRRAEAAQRADGAIPAGPASPWACSICVAQLASAWFRTGRRERAERALAYLLSIQDDSGAIPEHTGAPAPSRRSPAASATLIDAVHRRIVGAFGQQVDGFEDHIRAGDGRVGFLLREAGSLAGLRVLDAGCGRGAVARALLTAYPSAQVTAMDLSEEMLAHAPRSAVRRRGSIQNLPFADASFDVAYCVEALEHAGNPEGAVYELCRVVTPGGRVLIVDKNAERAGALAIEDWETWFDRREVEGWLGRHCTDVRSALLVHCPELGPDLFIGWRGTRRSG